MVFTSINDSKPKVGRQVLIRVPQDGQLESDYFYTIGAWDGEDWLIAGDTEHCWQADPLAEWATIPEEL